MRTIENDFLKVSIADHGAELTSVTDKATGAEKIWTGDPDVWNRHAPILFPFVGKVYDGKYRIGSNEYDMRTQHGFARDQDFECIKRTDTSITHRLKATAGTRRIYPYDFSLLVTHSLLNRSLYVEWRIENREREIMYYSIGGHPGFLLPPDVKKEDCFLVFPGKSSLTYFQANAAGYALPDEKKVLSLKGGLAAWQDDIPDTWIFEDQGISSVGIALPDQTLYVTLNCPSFPLLAVWANPKGSFICLEPWFGRTDDEGFAGKVSEKPHIQTLKPGEETKISYSIDFH